MRTINSILIVALAAMSFAGPHDKHHTAVPAVQKITIVVDNGFKPETVKVKAGQPVQLTFDVKHRSCASTVVFESLKITKNLQDGKKTIVKFTPKKAGTIRYACGMGMLKGSVSVK